MKLRDKTKESVGVCGPERDREETEKREREKREKEREREKRERAELVEGIERNRKTHQEKLRRAENQPSASQGHMGRWNSVIAFPRPHAPS